MKIQDQIIEHYKSGKTQKQLVEMGFNDGTTRRVIKKYQREHEMSFLEYIKYIMSDKYDADEEEKLKLKSDKAKNYRETRKFKKYE